VVEDAPVQRVPFLAALAYLLVLAGLITLRGEIIALAMPVIVMLAFAYLTLPDGARLSITRILSAERVSIDAPFTVKVRVHNEGEHLENLRLEDQHSPLLRVVEGVDRRQIRLRSGETFEWEYKLAGPRGYHVFPEVKVTVSDALGLVERTAFIPTTGRVFVLPPFKRLRRIYIRPRQTRVYSGNIPARQGGSGVDFFGVREYQPGDSPQWINWLANARHPDHLYSNQYEQERVADIGIILDCRRLTNSIKDRSLLEHSITVAATLIDAFIKEGNRVGLLLYGQYLQWTVPGYGKKQRERLFQALAQASLGDSQIFAKLVYIPTRIFPANSQLVLISALHEEDIDILVRLRLLGYHVLVISPDPIEFEQQALPHTPQVINAARILRLERQLLLQRVQRAGIQAVSWDLNTPLELCLHQALSRPPFHIAALYREFR
jgi:uncharacterized protein (DUF58 family)